MSDISQINDTCPTCSQPQEITLYRSVNVTLNPELKDRLLRQELTMHVCTACQTTVPLDIELLYHDMTKKQMIQIEFDDVPQRRDRVMGLMSDYLLRKVNSLQALIEKVCIFDCELDDRVMAVLKVVMCHTMLARYGETLEKLRALPLNPSNLVFLKKTVCTISGEGQPAGDAPQEQLLFLFLLPMPHPMNAMFIVTPLSAYEKYRTELNSKLDNIAPRGKWHRINYSWADQLVGQELTPVEMNVMMSPEMIESDPIANSMCRIHSERVQAYLKAMRDVQPAPGTSSETQNTGTWGRLKKWMGW